MTGTPAAIIAAAVALVAATACGSDGRRQPSARAGATPGPLASAVTAAGDLRIAIMEVVRLENATLEVRFTVEHLAKAGAPLDLANHFAASPGDGGTVADVHLTDSVSQKKYFVIRDARGRPACSEAIRPIAPGETRWLWARFLAPPPGVSRIGVRFPPLATVLEAPIGPAPGAGGSSPDR